MPHFNGIQLIEPAAEPLYQISSGRKSKAFPK
jgi:hypothetical protein